MTLGQVGMPEVTNSISNEMFHEVVSISFQS